MFFNRYISIFLAFVLGLSLAFAAKPKKSAKPTAQALEQHDKGLEFLNAAEPALAIPFLQSAVKGGVATANLDLAKAYSALYDVDRASEYLDKAADARGIDNNEVDILRQQLMLMRNMLERVEDIVIVDSIVVPFDRFFSSYTLSPDAGRIMAADILASRIPDISPESAMFTPQSATEHFVSMQVDSAAQLASIGVLDDGSLQEPVLLGEHLNNGGDAAFPFLLPDGVTLYFAANGDASIGGYDIMMTRRDSDGRFLAPQNIGMPYNSPYNDYMLAIDEVSGLGWWATDRGCAPGYVNIYVFVPNTSRKNLSPDDPNLLDRARISSIAATVPAGFSLAPFQETLTALSKPDDDLDTPYDLNTTDTDIYVVLPDGKILTKMSQVVGSERRNAVSRYVEAQKRLALIQRTLQSLRQQYAAGNSALAQSILDKEQQLIDARADLDRAYNAFARLYSSR